MLPPSMLLQLWVVKERECRQLDTSRHITINVIPRLRVIGVISLTRVKMGDPRGEIADVTVDLEAEHAGGHIVAELLYLFPDITKEGVT